jgi:hypothetical protein
MGIFGKMSSSCYDRETSSAYTRTIGNDSRNPNPYVFKIVNHFEHNGFLLVLINYPNCTNYEGNKVLLFKNMTYRRLMKQKVIDPHFSATDKFNSPIARFEPTALGWYLGQALIEKIS